MGVVRMYRCGLVGVVVRRYSVVHLIRIPKSTEII